MNVRVVLDHPICGCKVTDSWEPVWALSSMKVLYVACAKCGTASLVPCTPADCHVVLAGAPAAPLSDTNAAQLRETLADALRARVREVRERTGESDEKTVLIALAQWLGV